MMKKTYPVEGMHCASCASIITTKVSKMPGVEVCAVNFGTKNATIEFDHNKVTSEQIAQEVEKYGYHLIHDHQADVQQVVDEEKNPELVKALEKLKIAMPTTVVALVIMITMIGNDYGWWTMNMVLEEFFHHLLPILATIMLTVVGWKYIVAIGRYIRYGVANMDTLVGIGTSVAFLYSFLVSAFEVPLSDILDTSRLFYEAVIVVIGFIELGKYLEIKVMSKTGKAIKALVGLQVKQAIVIRDEQEISLPIDQVQLGDIMKVKPGEKIPLDGIVVLGKGDIDESMITGEPLPVSKTRDDTVVGSTIVTNSTLHVQATAIGGDTYLSKIVAIVTDAQNSKPQIQQLVDQIMKWFIPVVLLIALSAGLFWLFFGNYFYPDINALQFAVMSFVGVLVIACPCGLGLATPMAIVTGVGHGAKNGILTKNADGILQLRKTNIVVFDKTGTITEGKPTLVEIQELSEDTLGILASLENNSSHPIAHAIVQYAKMKDITLSQVEEFKNLEGVGVQGEINGTTYVVSKPSYLTTLGVTYDVGLIDAWTKEGKTPLLLSAGKEILGYYAVADSLKDTSKQAVEELKKLGIEPIMLTGDHTNTAQYIAAQIGIDRVYAEVKPEQKADIIRELQKEGMVTMVGDGINDAPALATADIGVAMSTGTDVAIESADITLLHGDLSKLVKAITISKLTQTAIVQNLAWAFGFNLLGIPLAAGVFYPVLGVLLNPAFEGAAMAFSDLTVVGNSLRLQNKKIGNKGGSAKGWLGGMIVVAIIVSLLRRGFSALINPDIKKSSFGTTNVTSFLNQEVVYIASEGGRVDIINASGGNVVDSILLSGYSIHNVYYHKDKNMLYISANAMSMEGEGASMGTSSESDFLLVFDSISHKIIAKISLGSNNNLSHVVLSEDGKYLLINHQDKGTTSIIDGTSYKLLGFYERGEGTKPHGMRISSNNKAYIALMGSKALGVLDISQNTGYTISLRGVPVQVALTKDGTIYTSLYTTRQIAEIIDGEINYISLPGESQGPIQIGVTPNQQYLVVADQGGLNQDERGNTIYVYDRIKKVFTGSVIMGQGPHGVVVEDTAAYITNIADNTVSKVSLESMQVIYTTDVSEEPNGIVRGVY